MYKKKKILFLINSLNHGGAEKVLVDLVNSLPSEIFDITLLSIKNEGILRKQLSPKVHFKCLFKTNKPFFYKWFYRLVYHFNLFLIYPFIIRGHFDVEVAFLEGLSTHIVGGSIKRTRKIAWVHTDMINNPWSDIDFKNYNQQKNIYGKFDDIVCVSKYCANQFIQKFGFSEKVKTFYNSIPTNAILEKAKRNIDFKCDSFCFVSVGRLVRQKGFDRLIKSHLELIKKGIKNTLVIIGDGPEKQMLESLIVENHLGKTVKLYGYISNPYSILSKADCFVSSSRSEGYSTVIAEAFILGIPVIATKCSGSEELLNDGKFGMLIDNNDCSLTSAMELMVLDKETRFRYKKLALEHSKDFDFQFNLSKISRFLKM